MMAWSKRFIRIFAVISLLSSLTVITICGWTFGSILYYASQVENNHNQHHHHNPTSQPYVSGKPQIPYELKPEPEIGTEKVSTPSIIFDDNDTESTTTQIMTTTMMTTSLSSSTTTTMEPYLPTNVPTNWTTMKPVPPTNFSTTTMAPVPPENSTIMTTTENPSVGKGVGPVAAVAPTLTNDNNIIYSDNSVNKTNHPYIEKTTESHHWINMNKNVSSNYKIMLQAVTWVGITAGLVQSFSLFPLFCGKSKRLFHYSKFTIGLHFICLIMLMACFFTPMVFNDACSPAGSIDTTSQRGGEGEVESSKKSDCSMSMMTMSEFSEKMNHDLTHLPKKPVDFLKTHLNAYFTFIGLDCFIIFFCIIIFCCLLRFDDRYDFL